VVELLYKRHRNYSLKSCGKRFFCTFVAIFYTWNVGEKNEAEKEAFAYSW
jgi:hypothetical protein